MSKWVQCANYCGRWVWPLRIGHIYCSDKCRWAAAQRRKYNSMSKEKRLERNRRLKGIVRAKEMAANRARTNAITWT